MSMKEAHFKTRVLFSGNLCALKPVIRLVVGSAKQSQECLFISDAVNGSTVFSRGWHIMAAVLPCSRVLMLLTLQS